MQRAGAVVGDDHDVAAAGEVDQRAHRLVEDPVDLGHGAGEPVRLPLGPAEVVDVVGGHEDDEEQLGVEPLGQPRDDLDLLGGRAANDVEVELPVGQRELVVELERPVAPAQLVAQRLRVRQPLLARRRVEARHRKPVDLGRGPGEGHVHDARPPTGAAQPVPEGRRPPEAPVHEPELIAGLVPLDEVPDPVTARVDAADDRRPGVRGQGCVVERRTPRAPRVAQPPEVRKLARGQHRVDDVERRRVEPDEGQVWTGHPRKQPLQVRRPPY